MTGTSGSDTGKTVLGQHGFARSMTVRARWYLTIAAIRHLLVAGFALFAAESFQSPNFKPMISAAPLWVWGVVFTGAGFVLAAGAWRKSARIARWGLILSATSTAMVAVGLALALFDGGDFAAPIGAIMFTAVAAKDFTVCADPLRSPFEDWVEEIITGEATNENEPQ